MCKVLGDNSDRRSKRITALTGSLNFTQKRRVEERCVSAISSGIMRIEAHVTHSFSASLVD